MRSIMSEKPGKVRAFLRPSEHTPLPHPRSPSAYKRSRWVSGVCLINCKEIEMSGMNVSGQILIQEPSSSGFIAHVYPSRLDAAIQLLRVMIRRAKDEGEAMSEIEDAVAELISEERHDLDMEMATERRRRGEEP
jgi:hypothetical protein